VPPCCTSWAKLPTRADSADITADFAHRDHLGVDSMDFLSFLIALDKELKVEVPERDYGQVTVIDACVDYLTERMSMGASA
jgi:acyl carrier protein